MKLQKDFIEIMSRKIVDSMIKENLILWEDSPEKLAAIVSQVIANDLSVEDRLNEEVKTLIDARTKDYERNMMDYGRVFQMVKSKLARERGLIL